MAREKAKFESQSGAVVYIEDIDAGYVIDYVFPFSFADRTDNTLSAYDPGGFLDYVKTKLKIKCDKHHAKNLERFFNKYRDEDIYFQAPESWGVYLFGPMFSPTYKYRVGIEDFKNKGQAGNPYLYHRFDLTLIYKNVDGISYLDESACGEDGNITIDTIPGFRFPQKYFSPDVVYAVEGVSTNAGHVYNVSRSLNSDKRKTKAQFWCTKEIISRVMHRLINVTRSKPFVINTPRNSFPFAVGGSDNAGYLVRLSDNTIRMKHNNYRDWDFEIEFIKIS